MTANHNALHRNLFRQRELEALKTSVLLDYLKWTRRFNGFYSPWDGPGGYTTEQIKAVLATREHIPNRQERRANRQAEAKRRKHR